MYYGNTLGTTICCGRFSRSEVPPERAKHVASLSHLGTLSEALLPSDYKDGASPVPLSSHQLCQFPPSFPTTTQANPKQLCLLA